MNREEDLNKVIDRKCSSCYKNDWCMLTPYQRAVDCLGPLEDVEDNLKKYREYFEKEREKPKVDLDRAVREVVFNTYLRNKKLFEDW